MYDAQDSDTDREWIEIHNTSSSAIDLTKYRYNDGVSSSNHTFVSPPSFPAGGYLILVDKPTNFLAANSTFTSGMLVDTVLSSLNNTSGTLSMVDCTTTPCVTIDTVSYNVSQGAGGDGKSLQRKLDDSWVAATPTPGGPTTATQSTTTTDTTTSQGATSGLPAIDPSQVVAPQKVVVPVHMQAVLSVPADSLTGIEIPISVKVTGWSGEYRGYGAFHYSFGDGTDASFKNPEPTNHIYEFPGTYIVSFDYRSNPYSKNPEVTTESTVEIVDSPIRITTDDERGLVSIANDSTSEVALSRWNLEQEMQSGKTIVYVFPEGMNILSKKVVRLSQKVTHFDFSQNYSIHLVLPTGILTAESIDSNQSSSPQINMIYEVSSPVPRYTPPVVQEIPNVRQDTPPQNNLSANAIGSVEDRPDVLKNESTRSLIPYLLALLGIIVGAIIVFKTSGVFSIKKNLDDGKENADSDTKTIADAIRIIDEEEV
jgi:hypothetical protein